MKLFNKKQKRKIIHQLIDDGGLDWIESDEVFWSFVCSNFNLFEDFIREHKDVLNWDEMCKNKIVNDSDMLREFRDKINWTYLKYNSVTSLTDKQRKEFEHDLNKLEEELSSIP